MDYIVKDFFRWLEKDGHTVWVNSHQADESIKKNLLTAIMKSYDKHGLDLQFYADSEIPIWSELHRRGDKGTRGAVVVFGWQNAENHMKEGPVPAPPVRIYVNYDWKMKDIAERKTVFLALASPRMRGNPETYREISGKSRRLLVH